MDMEAIVKAFTDKDVVVMLTTCDYGGDYPPDEDAWNDIRDNVKYNFTTYKEINVIEDLKSFLHELKSIGRNGSPFNRSSATMAQQRRLISCYL